MGKGNKLTGYQKSALLFITIGPETSAPILKKMSEQEVQKITYEIANISTVNQEQRQQILEEFIEINKAKDFLVEGGFEYAKNLLSKAFGTQKANDILAKVAEATQTNKPFSIARKADPQQLLNVILYEHPQTIALILCYIQPEKAAQILADLPEDIQADVSFRIATMNTTSPEILQEVEVVLEERLSNIVKAETTTLGGIGALVDILNQVDRSTERHITESLETEDAELAEKIKSSMFVFEDIVNLENAYIQRILREVDAKDLAIALKGCSEAVGQVIYSNLSKRAAESLKEEVQYLGPIRLVEVEKTQQKIVSIIRKLDEAQEIVIARGGEDAIIV